MKSIFILGFLFLPLIIFSQIPNAGFEDGLVNWVGTGSLTISINTSTIYNGLQSLDCTINSDVTNGDLRAKLYMEFREILLTLYLFGSMITIPQGEAGL